MNEQFLSFDSCIIRVSNIVAMYKIFDNEKPAIRIEYGYAVDYHIEHFNSSTERDRKYIDLVKLLNGNTNSNVFEVQ